MAQAQQPVFVNPNSWATPAWQSGEFWSWQIAASYHIVWRLKSAITLQCSSTTTTSPSSQCHSPLWTRSHLHHSYTSQVSSTKSFAAELYL